MEKMQRQPVTKILRDGIILRLSDGRFIGFKCQHCSTSEVADEDTIMNRKLIVPYISQAMYEHSGCRWMV